MHCIFWHLINYNNDQLHAFLGAVFFPHLLSLPYIFTQISKGHPPIELSYNFLHDLSAKWLSYLQMGLFFSFRRTFRFLCSVSIRETTAGLVWVRKRDCPSDVTIPESGLCLPGKQRQPAAPPPSLLRGSTQRFTRLLYMSRLWRLSTVI